MLREYSGNAKPTVLSGGVSAAATAIAVADGSGYPTGATGPFVITIDAELAAEEKVLCVSRTGNTLTVNAGGRGFDGTTAGDHDNAASVAHTYSATDAREANAHVNDVAGDPHPQYLTPAEGDAAYAPAASTAALNAGLAGKLDVGAKAADAELLDGLDSLAFVPRSIVDAAGDLIVGTANDTIARLAKGADGTVLGVAAGALAYVAGAQMVTGSYTGDGVASRSIALTFTPQLVVLTSRGNSGNSVRFSISNIGGGAIGLTTGGSISTTNTDRPSLAALGFTVGNASGKELNTTSVVYDYFAIGMA